MTPKYWTKLRAGHYAGLVVIGSLIRARFEIFYEPEYKLWYCTLNGGPVFDCASTLREAKTLCTHEA